MLNRKNILAPTRSYLFMTLINLHLFCINYLPNFDLKTALGPVDTYPDIFDPQLFLSIKKWSIVPAQHHTLSKIE